MTAADRCTAHPARPAAGACPRCGRPRCAADADRYAAGCGVCTVAPAAAPPAPPLELVVRAGLAAMPAIFLGGWIVTQYVYDHVFSWLLPGLLGLAASLAAGAAQPGISRREAAARRAVPLAAVVAGLLGTGLGFRLLPGARQSLVHPLSVVGAPYLAAIVGAVVGPMVFGPPRRRDGAG